MTGYIVFFILLFLVPSVFKRRKSQVWAYFFILVLFSGIRYGMSYDYFMYVSFIEGGYNHTEAIPAMIETLARNLNSPPLYFVLTSCMVTAFVMLSIYRASSNISLSTFLYVGLPMFFFQDLSTVRQAMASSIIFYLIVRLGQRRVLLSGKSNKQFLEVVFLISIAFLCHKAAIVALILFFPWVKLTRKAGILLVCIAFIIGMMIVPIISILTSIVGGSIINKLNVYIATPMEGFFFVRAGMYIIIALLYMKYETLVQINPRNKFYLNISIVAIIINALLIVNSHLALRSSIFFWGPVLLLLPDYIRIIKISRFACKVCCIMLFMISILTAYVQTLFAEPTYYFYPYTTIFDKDAVF